jgi:hypothetical protein
MTFILGMDPLVFIAWIGTILAAIFCVIYGIYYEFIKKSESYVENNKSLKFEKKQKEEG